MREGEGRGEGKEGEGRGGVLPWCRRSPDRKGGGLQGEGAKYFEKTER